MCVHDLGWGTGNLGREKPVSVELLRTADTELLCDHRVSVKDQFEGVWRREDLPSDKGSWLCAWCVAFVRSSFLLLVFIF